MSWNLYFFNRFSEEACKEAYYKYYLKIYAYVQWLIPDRCCVENITLHTLLRVCNHGNLHEEDALLAFVRSIATNKCLDYLKKECWLKEHYKEYLTNNEHSAELLESAFNNALLMEKRLIEWKQLSPAEQEAMISTCTSSSIPLNFLL
jgi:DNA-directed RNA polymerase specialized sigma24 family protein